MRSKNHGFLILLLFFLQGQALQAQPIIDLEAGLVTTGYNDVRIPGDQGTLISLNDELEAQPDFFYRLRANYIIRSRHTLSILYAPLKLDYKDVINKDVFFEDVSFPSNSNLETSYKFNSYRFTYRYALVKNSGLEFGLGITAKIRDARITFSSSGLKSEKTNLGFVPLINFRLLWHLKEKFGILLEGDALAAKQGRAEDVLLAGSYKISDHIHIRAGYRILEGGADNNEVYNFSLFHYALVGLAYTF